MRLETLKRFKLGGASPGAKKKTIRQKKPKKLKIVSEKELATGAEGAAKRMATKRLNEDFIAVLGELETVMSKKGEFMRSRAYNKAQQALLTLGEDIVAVDQLSGVKGIGKTIMAKLKEFQETGQIAALEREKANPMLVFSEIYGIGPKKAAELIAAGITSVAELRKHKDKLNDKQLIGLQYYEDIQQRIPRAEIGKYEELLRKTLATVSGSGKSGSGARMEIVGSYRRGNKTSGDIDIILTNADDDAGLVKRMVERLIADGVILHVLAQGKSKALVVAKLPGSNVARRLDFLYSPPAEYAFATLYFTGSKVFNMLMRQRALDMGYTLNEHGIHRMVSGKKGAKVEGVFPAEEDIFAFFKMKYKAPEERVNARAIEELGAAAVEKEVKKEKKEKEEKEEEEEELGRKRQGIPFL